LCLAGGRPAGAGSPDWSLNFSLGQNNQATIESSGGELRVRTTAGQQITLQADGSLSAAASGLISVSAPQVTVNAGMSKFSWVVQRETLIAQAVVAASYTPGAGNLW
jgi:hypothetical protein